MDVCNVHATDTVNLDSNANFETQSDANIALAPQNCVSVANNGTTWFQASPTKDQSAGATSDGVVSLIQLSDGSGGFSSDANFILLAGVL